VVSADTMALILSPDPMPVEVIAADAALEAVLAVLLAVLAVDEVVPDTAELIIARVPFQIPLFIGEIREDLSKSDAIERRPSEPRPQLCDIVDQKAGSTQTSGEIGKLLNGELADDQAVGRVDLLHAGVVRCRVDAEFVGASRIVEKFVQ
jgi:hypothetical protein